jgi:cytochrome c biogenesis protein CcdA
MLALVAASHMKIISGVILLLSYSLGHSIPLVAAGSSISFAQSLSQSPKFARIGKAVKIIFGILLLALSAFLVISAFHAH